MQLKAGLAASISFSPRMWSRVLFLQAQQVWIKVGSAFKNDHVEDLLWRIINFILTAKVAISTKKKCITSAHSAKHRNNQFVILNQNSASSAISQFDQAFIYINSDFLLKSAGFLRSSVKRICINSRWNKTYSSINNSFFEFTYRTWPASANCTF